MVERRSSERKKASHSNLYHRHTSCLRLLSHFNAIPFRSDEPRLSLLTYALECTYSLMRYGHTSVHNRLPNVCTSAFSHRCTLSRFSSLSHPNKIKFTQGKRNLPEKIYYEIACDRIMCIGQTITCNAHTATETIGIKTIEFSFVNDIYKSCFDNKLKFIPSFLYIIFLLHITYAVFMNEFGRTCTKGDYREFFSFTR